MKKTILIATTLLMFACKSKEEKLKQCQDQALEKYSEMQKQFGDGMKVPPPIEMVVSSECVELIEEAKALKAKDPIEIARRAKAQHESDSINRITDSIMNEANKIINEINNK